MGLSGFACPCLIDDPVSGHAHSLVGVNAGSNQEVPTDITTTEKDY